ncbi:MAG: hypothetical protein AAF684_08665 [Pseudomonadota bacterium]
MPPMRVLFIALFTPFALPAAAQPIDHAKEYDACLALAETRPASAFDSALSWAGLGGGDAAQHCAGVALIRMGKPDHGAQRLETLATASTSAGARLRAALLGQAAQGWMLAGELERAEGALNAAIRLDALDSALFADRSQIRGLRKDYDGALRDADTAIRMGGRGAEAHLFRAAALRGLNRCAEALEASGQADALAPGLPDVALERGYCLRDLGRRAEAQAAFLAAAQATDETVAEPARFALQALEGG